MIRSGFHEQGKLSRREVCDVDIGSLHVLRETFGILASFWISDADSTATRQRRPDLHDREIETDGRLVQESLARVEGEIVVKRAQHLLSIRAREGDALGFARTSLNHMSASTSGEGAITLTEVYTMYSVSFGEAFEG